MLYVVQMFRGIVVEAPVLLRLPGREMDGGRFSKMVTAIAGALQAVSADEVVAVLVDDYGFQVVEGVWGSFDYRPSSRRVPLG